MEWVVTPEESGLKLITFLTQRLEGKYSSRFIKRLIDHHCCEVNGRKERFASITLAKKDHVRLHLEQSKTIAPTPKKMDLSRILYEDDVLLVYNKPAGINSDEQGILSLFKSTYPSLRLVHRLDRDTTGVLLFSKQDSSFEQLVTQFKNLQVEKSYLAIVDGVFQKKKGIIENCLGKKKALTGQTLWGVVAGTRGLPACTAWEVLKSGKKASLIACKPKTGRTHQIRVHMAGLGHPILGDFQYGKQFQCSYRTSRILLHAESICIAHPLTGERLCFKAPLPEDFKQAEHVLFKGMMSQKEKEK